jgi:hypothetical protein
MRPYRSRSHDAHRCVVGRPLLVLHPRKRGLDGRRSGMKSGFSRTYRSIAVRSSSGSMCFDSGSDARAEHAIVPSRTKYKKKRDIRHQQRQLAHQYPAHRGGKDSPNPHGEEQANLSCYPLARGAHLPGQLHRCQRDKTHDRSRCRFSFRSGTVGIEGNSEGWGEEPDAGTVVSVSMVAPEHLVTLRQIRTWVEKGSGTPKDMALRHRLRDLLPG